MPFFAGRARLSVLSSGDPGRAGRDELRSRAVGQRESGGGGGGASDNRYGSGDL